MEKTIYLSYDLGITGDYDGLYAWLDDHEAKECGDSVALLRYAYDGDFREALKADLEGSVSLDKRSRIYVVYRADEKMRGKFLFGRRRRSPWDGRGSGGEDADDEE